MDILNINVVSCSVEVVQAEPDRAFVQSCTFPFQRSDCCARVNFGWEHSQRKVKIFIKSDPRLPEPFYATVVIFKGDNLISFPEKLIKDQSNCILSVPYSDVEKVLRDASQRKLHIRVTLQKYPKSSYDPNYCDEKSEQTSQRGNENNSLLRLSEDLEKLLDGHIYHDVLIKCGNIFFKAHKFVLSARSNYFKKKLQSTDDRIEVPSMDPSVFDAVMRYIYTGKYPQDMSFEIAKKLHKAGDLCDIVHLKEQCAKFFVDNLSIDNACACLAMTDDGELKEKIISYIIEKDIPFQKEYWQPFCKEYPQVANDVLNILVEQLRNRKM